MHSSITRMQNQNYYLWGSIITVMLIILFELGKLPDHLIGQDDIKKNYIQLYNGGEIRSISSGSWVAVVQKDAPHPIIGILRGNIEKNLLIENSKTNQGELVPYSKIEIIYHGEAKRIKHYALKGAKTGFKLALAYGSFWGYLFLNDGYGIDDAFIIGLMGVGCGSAAFIPPGALIGYLKGLSKDKKATEYIFEDGWEIL